MVKTIAALLMLVDHIGYIFFPQTYILRIIGRLSMPLYAYSIARGFNSSIKNNRFKKYISNMFILAIVSQLPYSMIATNLNICFTWCLSLFALYVIYELLTKNKKENLISSVVYIISLFLIFIPVGINIVGVDYGISGVILPILFYLLIYFNKETVLNYYIVLMFVWFLYSVNSNIFTIQIQFFSVFCAIILPLCKKYDKVIKLPKWFYYAFYPAHLTILILIYFFINI